ncbi:MAG TPA: response regulator [Woeseiaceae bacterium]|nr:response regulator [Woeseiaceae bacterium]
METPAPLIAVVDDEKPVRRALMRLLQGERYRVEAFESAAGFLDSLPTEIPRCVILDLQMPDMSGVELQQRMLELDLHLPVIVITAHDRADMHQRCLALGARWYFCKPVEASELLEAVRIAVNRHPASR